MESISNVKRAGRDSSRGSSGPGRRGDARRYESPLREEQARQTRERILEALTRIMARGVSEISVPAVAREAGVSTPTVYRHFGSKRHLVAALGAYLLPRTGLLPDRPAADLGELAMMSRTLYRRYDRMDATIRAAMASQLGNEVRRERMPERIDYFRTAIQGSRPDLATEDLERMATIVLILFSSAAMRAFKDYLDLTADEAAEHVVWAIDHLAKGL